MSNKIKYIKNAKLFIENIKNNIKIANIYPRTIKQKYEGEW